MNVPEGLWMEIIKDILILAVFIFVFLYPVPNYLGLGVVCGALIAVKIRDYKDWLYPKVKR